LQRQRPFDCAGDNALQFRDGPGREFGGEPFLLLPLAIAGFMEAIAGSKLGPAGHRGAFSSAL